MVLFSAHCLIMPYICRKFHEEILNCYNKVDTKHYHLNFDSVVCDLDLHWTGLIYEFCTSSLYGQHFSKVSKSPFKL